MANAVKSIYQGQPATTIGTLATVPGSKKWLVTSIIIVNVTATQATITISKVPNGGTAGVTNRILDAMPINGHVTEVVELSLVMDTPGDFLAGLQGTASALTVTISGVEIS